MTSAFDSISSSVNNVGNDSGALSDFGGPEEVTIGSSLLSARDGEATRDAFRKVYSHYCISTAGFLEKALDLANEICNNWSQLALP